MSRAAPRLRLRGGRVLTADGWRDECDVRIGGGAIVGIGAGATDEAAETIDVRGHVVAAGLVDLHVHGAGGAMFEDADADGVRRIRGRLAAHGTTALLATIAALPPEPLRRAVATVTATMREEVGASLLGIHLEGPFLNPRRGGAQRADWMRPPSLAELDALHQVAEGHIRLLTLAPELPGALEVIRHARALGVAVSLGHSEATAAEVDAAIAAGATHVTHCFNAMPPLHHRAPGLLGVALADDRLRVELIADGVHVDRRALTLAMRSKPRGGWLLVSDGVAAVGQAPGPLRLFGADCVVTDAVRRIDDGRLAGSSLTLAAAVRNLRDWMPDLADDLILDAASAVPAAAIDRADHGQRVAIGRRADLILLDAEWRLAGVVRAGEALIRSC
ncbi:N-acetylglucosamine-6-phosphate deacetylase [bacterium]|nr:N-acetylglucosamine-6-phosphate deacetylase [bacterium]